jgi:hypothetical protein
VRANRRFEIGGNRRFEIGAYLSINGYQVVVGRKRFECAGIGCVAGHGEFSGYLMTR